MSWSWLFTKNITNQETIISCSWKSTFSRFSPSGIQQSVSNCLYDACIPSAICPCHMHFESSTIWICPCSDDHQERSTSSPGWGCQTMVDATRSTETSYWCAKHHILKPPGFRYQSSSRLKSWLINFDIMDNRVLRGWEDDPAGRLRRWAKLVGFVTHQRWQEWNSQGMCVDIFFENHWKL